MFIWLLLVCVLYNRLCFRGSVGRPYNFTNLWSSWEPLNLELSESGCGWPPEILGGVCSRGSLVGALGVSCGVPTACLVGVHTPLQVPTRLPEVLSALRLPVTTPAHCTRHPTWGHRRRGARLRRPRGPSPPCRLYSAPVPKPATPLSRAGPRGPEPRGPGGQRGSSQRPVCFVPPAGALDRQTDRRRDVKLSGFLLAADREHLALSGSERESSCQAGSAGPSWQPGAPGEAPH